MNSIETEERMMIVVAIEFKNGSKIVGVGCNSNSRGLRSKNLEYFMDVNDYLSNLSDEEFDQILLECGIEKCPRNPLQVIVSEFAEDKLTLDQAESKIKELIIAEIDKQHLMNCIIDKNDSFLAGMGECTKIIENLWR